jgi:hypothetical protein
MNITGAWSDHTPVAGWGVEGNGTDAGWHEDQDEILVTPRGPGDGVRDGPAVKMDVLLKDVDTCYANVDVALRRNEVDQVSNRFSSFRMQDYG